MEITVSSRGADPSEALLAATQTKVGRLQRFVDGMDTAQVHFTEARNPRIADKETCEVLMEGHGQQVRCRASAADRFTALDRAVEKLEHQLTTLKSKLSARGR